MKITNSAVTFDLELIFDNQEKKEKQKILEFTYRFDNRMIFNFYFGINNELSKQNIYEDNRNKSSDITCTGIGVAICESFRDVILLLAIRMDLCREGEIIYGLKLVDEPRKGESNIEI